MIKKISIYSGGILSTRHPQDDRKRYSDTLNSQVIICSIHQCLCNFCLSYQIHEKCDFNLRTRQFEEEQQKRHFESWETFWGRPGYGAPREVLFVRFFVHSNFS